jgi:hypothetical protein
MIFASDFGQIIPWWVHALVVVVVIIIALAASVVIIALATVCITFLVARFSSKKEPEDMD